MPTFETSTGESVTYRVLPPGTYERIGAAIRTEWAAEAPKPTVEIVQTEAGLVEKVRDTHPDHLKALAAFDQRVNVERGKRLARLICDYAVTTPTDDAQVAAFREAMQAQGVTYDDDTDRELFVWAILIPDSDDQQLLTGRVLGGDMSALVEARRREFRRQMERRAHRIHQAADGEAGDEPEPGVPRSGAVGGAELDEVPTFTDG